MYSILKISAQRRWRSLLSLLLAALMLATTLVPLTGQAQVLPQDQLDGQAWSEFGVQAELMPDVTMAAGALVTGDGRVLWSRNIDEHRAPASITKIMTAILAFEHLQAGQELTMPPMRLEPAESRAFLREGDILTREQLIESLLIVSGNDAAQAIAQIVADDIPSFVKLMNERAVELGMNDSHFHDASGLDFPDQYTTARDLATLARFAMTKPEFREVVGSIETSFTTNRRHHDLHNTNILLQSYNGATGIKTGRTTGAGFSVIVSAERNGLELYAIVLGTGADLTRFFEARRLLDFGFTHYREKKLALESTVVGAAQVTNFPDKTVQVAVAQDVSLPVLDVAGTIDQHIEINTTRSPVRRGDELGFMTFTQRDRLIARVPLIATQEVNDPFFLVQWYYNAVIAWRNRGQ
ncbi:MAG: D-alanyl-D-alanine carboxypeptidase [Coriobacteriia bacterium]|nr:D-alanyl-D-alanine carboxypeptidase [Coriobacteriia bacterium]